MKCVKSVKYKVSCRIVLTDEIQNRMTVGQDEKDKDDHSKMVQLLRNGSMVEVRVDKVSFNFVLSFL